MAVQSPLNTVQSLVDDVRVLILDTMLPNRYTDDEIMVALNTALLEARRVRADLFVTRWGGNVVPYYALPTGEEFCMEAQFRLAFVYGTVGHVLLRDEEDVQDERANTFRGLFYSILGAPTPPPIRGGTPSAPKKQG